MTTLLWVLFFVAALVAAVGFVLIRQAQRGGSVAGLVPAEIDQS